MRTLSERFEMKVDRSGGPNSCHVWTGARHPLGYGHIYAGGSVRIASRVALSLAGRPVPDELQVDHLCRNPTCVNPAHLEAVTQRVNVLRGISFSAENARKTECSKGHPLSGENLRVDPSSGQRTCKRCNREAVARLRRRRVAR